MSVVATQYVGTNSKWRDILNLTEYRPAIASTDIEDIARLRYAAYRREGAIGFIPDERLIDKFDFRPNGITFGVYLSGALAASIRIHVALPETFDTPAFDAFPELANLCFGKERSGCVIDPNRFVASHEASRTNPLLPYVVLRLPFMAATYLDAQLATATVREEHETFYRRILGYRPVLPPRPYPSLTKELGLMVADFPAEKARVLERYPVFHHDVSEARACYRSLKARLHGSPDNDVTRPTARAGGRNQAVKDNQFSPEQPSPAT